MNDAMKNCTVYERASGADTSDTRTFSYKSEEQEDEDDDDELSEPDIALNNDKAKKNLAEKRSKGAQGTQKTSSS